MPGLLTSLLSVFLFHSTAANVAIQPSAREYMVIESMDEFDARIESNHGTFYLPIAVLPQGAREGSVIQWHTDNAETKRRMDAGYRRIQRMQSR